MRLWLTKCHGGRYLLTVLRPTIHRIRGTRDMDAYEQLGEPLTVRHLCEPGIRALIGRTLEPLKPERVELTASVLGSP